MVIVSLIPYTDVLLSWFIDLADIKLKRFANLQVAIWSISTCISPLLVLYASKLRPWWPSYIVTIYINLTSLIGFILLETSILIQSEALFKLFSLILSIIILVIGKYFRNYMKVVILKDEIIHEINNIR